MLFSSSWFPGKCINPIEVTVKTVKITVQFLDNCLIKQMIVLLYNLALKSPSSCQWLILWKHKSWYSSH